MIERETEREREREREMERAKVRERERITLFPLQRKTSMVTAEALTQHST